MGGAPSLSVWPVPPSLVGLGRGGHGAVGGWWSVVGGGPVADHWLAGDWWLVTLGR